jgi:hypothetical protein
MQSVVAAQELLISWRPLALAVCTTVQLVPFHLSVSALIWPPGKV